MHHVIIKISPQQAHRLAGESFLCLIVWLFTNLPRHVVQRKTLAAPDNNAFVMVLPGSEDKEPSLGTGFHTFASRLCQVGKAILLKENKG